MAALLLACLLAETVANAAPPPENEPIGPARGIDWRAPADCGDAQALRAHAEDLLTEPAPASAWQEVRIEVRVSQEGPGYRTQMRLASSYGRSELTFEAQTCDEILAVVGVETALLLDAVAVAMAVEDKASEPEPEPEQEPPPEPEPPPEVAAPVEVEEPTHPWYPAVLVEGGLGLALFPGLTGQGELAFSATRNGWRLRGGAEYLGYGQPRSAEFPGEGADIQAFGLTMDACFLGGSSRLGLTGIACLGPRVGLMQGVGIGVRGARRVNEAYVGGRAQAALRLRLRPNLSVYLSYGVMLTAYQPVFSVEQLGDIYRAPLLSHGPRLGFEVALARVRKKTDSPQKWDARGQ